MTKLRTFLVGALLALAPICAALAQSVSQDNLSGNESWSAGQGPGGPSAFIFSDLTRNSRQIVVGTIAGAVTLGVTSPLTPLRWGGNFIVTAQPAVAVITTPPNPFPNGGVVGVCNPTAAAYATNAVTVAGNTGQTSPVNNTITALAAGACALFQFQRSNTSWYRIQ